MLFNSCMYDVSFCSIEIKTNNTDQYSGHSQLSSVRSFLTEPCNLRFPKSLQAPALDHVCCRVSNAIRHRCEEGAAVSAFSHWSCCFINPSSYSRIQSVCCMSILLSKKLRYLGSKAKLFRPAPLGRIDEQNA